MIRSEKGLTLIEVLAALTLVSIVFGLGMMLFFSLNTYWDSSTTNYNYKQNAIRTLNQVNQYLADSEEIWYSTSENRKELRIVTGVGEGDYLYKSIIWDEAASSLSESTLVGATRDNFTDPDLAFVLADTVVLSSHVTNMVVGIEASEGSNELVEWSTYTHKANGELFVFSVEMSMGTGNTKQFKSVHKLMSNPFTYVPGSRNPYYLLSSHTFAAPAEHSGDDRFLQ